MRNLSEGNLKYCNKNLKEQKVNIPLVLINVSKKIKESSISNQIIDSKIFKNKSPTKLSFKKSFLY